MKQTDTRQKDSIQSRAQKGHLLSFRDKSHVHSEAVHGPKSHPKKDQEKTADQTVAVPEVHAPKVGRNEPCSCGSGKKYKKCCLNRSTEPSA